MDTQEQKKKKAAIRNPSQTTGRVRTGEEEAWIGPRWGQQLFDGGRQKSRISSKEPWLQATCSVSCIAWKG